MRITRLAVQARDKNRVNVFVDNKYRFSLDILQVGDFGIKVGVEYNDQEIAALEEEGQFGKLYTLALAYAFARPRSQREMRDYLYRKTRDTRTKTGTLKRGVSKHLTERVFDRLVVKGYLSDEAFARFWVENRQLRKGISHRKLEAELQAKGVDCSIIERVMGRSGRRDELELEKIITKKARLYSDPKKLIAYLARQGFRYDDIVAAMDKSGYDDPATDET